MQTVQSISGRAGALRSPCQAVPDEVRVEERFEIVSADGARLAATLHAPAGEPKAAVQINPGIGIKRQFYRHFAAYLAARGYAVLSFDPRGMGESRREPLRRCKATMVDWGKKDMPAALAWLAQRYPNIPHLAVGHSMGGQLTGLMPNHHLLDGLVLVFSPKGDTYEYPWMQRVHGFLFMGLYMRLSVPLFGYAPVRFLMTAQDLPAGVARDWICAMYHRDHIKGLLAERGEASYFDGVKTPIFALALDTDYIAPPAVCKKLLREYFTAAESELLTLRAADAPAPSQLTHLGYFRKQFAESHWGQVAAWLDRRVDELSSEVDRPQALTA